MRLAVSAVLSFALAAVAFGQRGGHGGGVSRGGGGGFSRGGSSGGATRGGGFSRGGFSGGVARGGYSGGFARGGVNAGFNRGGGVYRGGMNRGGGIYRAPYRGNMFYRGGLGRGSRYRWPFYGYYGYPFYGASYYNDPYFYNDSSYGSGYPSTYTSGYSAEPYVYSYDVPPEPDYPPPPVASEPPPPPRYPSARSNAAPEYLIAFNDHNIKLVLAYWTEQTNLRYVTTGHEIKTAPLSSVDRDLSMRLNHERRVMFNLPSGP